MKDLESPVSAAYQKFFDRFAEIKTLNIEDWEIVHIIGYFCQKYQEHYNVKFSFKFNNTAPSKSYEVFQIKRISQMLSSDPIILKKYIDWIFEKKVIERKKRITSLGYLGNMDLINDFKFKYMINEPAKLDRTTLLSEKFLNIVKEYNDDALTYGDLSFVKKLNDSSPSDKNNEMFDNLRKNGFNLNILDEIK